MSVALPTVLPLPTRRPTWTEDALGRHTARWNGEYAGRIVANLDGSFVAFDGRSTPVGRYTTLRDARRAVDDVARGVTWARPNRFTRVAQSLASVTGVVAAAMLFAAGAQAMLPMA